VVILSDELNRTLWEMYHKQKFKEILFFVDTCEGLSLFEFVDIPNVYFITSSVKDEKASSYNYNYKLMTPTSDRMHFKLNEYLERAYREKKFNIPLHEFFINLKEKEADFIKSTVSIDNRLTRGVLFSEFFGNYLTPNHPVEKYPFTISGEVPQGSFEETIKANQYLKTVREKIDKEVTGYTKVDVSTYKMRKEVFHDEGFQNVIYGLLYLVGLYILSFIITN
jgi:glycosylphosphatidylinositol transamidase (GPIT) subunit GPI8